VDRWCRNRPAFQIWPHVPQRQYVDAVTSLLVVLTSADLQKGHGSAATMTAGGSGEVDTYPVPSTLRRVALTEPVFRDPLVADAAEIDNLGAPQPRRPE
jgi:hypothetical protein